jgi:hypothetical protein
MIYRAAPLSLERDSSRTSQAFLGIFLRQADAAIFSRGALDRLLREQARLKAKPRARN